MHHSPPAWVSNPESRCFFGRNVCQGADTVIEALIKPHNIGTLGARVSVQYRRVRDFGRMNLVWADLEARSL